MPNSSSTSSSERHEVLRFVRNALLFALPGVVVVLVVSTVDPFDFLFSHSLIPDAVKQLSATPLNPCLTQLVHFRREPSPVIFLGDSRMQSLKEYEVKAATGADVRNLGYGGGTLREALDSFYYADSVTRLQMVFLGINFDSYNDYVISRRTEAFRTIRSNPTLYFVNRTVLQATAYTLYSQLTGVDLKIGVPNVDRKTFWNETVRGEQTQRLLANYIQPVQYKQELVRLAEYCRNRGIKLTFVIFPTHRELREHVNEARPREYAQFKDTIASIAPTYDFDRPSDLTDDEKNFNDPLHFKKEWVKPIVSEFWFGQTYYSTLLSSSTDGPQPKTPVIVNTGTAPN